MAIMDRWEELSPKAKRIIILSAAGVGMIAAIKVFGDDTGTRRPNTNRHDVVRNVLTDRDTRNVGLEALSADLKGLRGDVLEVRRDQEKIRQEVDSITRTGQSLPAGIRSQLDQMITRMEKLEKAQTELLRGARSSRKEEEEAAKAADSTGAASVSDPIAQTFTDAEEPENSGLKIDPNDPAAIFRTAPWPTSSHTPVTTDGSTGQSIPPVATGPIRTVVEEAPADEAKEQADQNRDEAAYIPTSTIITGVLLNGMDAPTGQGARKDPFPATLRIQKEAILPNRFTADIRECFMLIAGYGDLSSERAYLRGESISCVRDDGAVIEAALDSYAVGEDGKAGVRGRLVSKQGQIIAKTLMAGFLSGVSEAFDVKPVPVIETRNTGTTSYSRNEPDHNWARSAAVSGAGSALEKIANFYLEMAESMFPVIEVDAGRTINIIVTRGTALNFKTRGTQTVR